MQMLLFIYILHSLNLTKGLDNTMLVPYTRSFSVNRLCPSGCTSCSALNGCLSCKPRLFFHLELSGMQQKGICLSSCPRGYYGKRSPHISTCNRCKEECHSCFSEHFCTRCPPGRFLFWGKCETSCPNGLTANTSLRECTVHFYSCKRAPQIECLETRHASHERRGTTNPHKVWRAHVCSDPCQHLVESWMYMNTTKEYKY